EHELAGVGEAPQLARRGRDLRDRAGAHVVAVGEAARDNGGVVPREVGVLVPEDVALDPRHERQRVFEVALAPRAGVAEDRDFHRLSDALAIREPATATKLIWPSGAEWPAR